jgi:hypothetical protein
MNVSPATKAVAISDYLAVKGDISRLQKCEIFEQVRNFILYYNNFRLKKDLGDLCFRPL